MSSIVKKLRSSDLKDLNRLFKNTTIKLKTNNKLPLPPLKDPKRKTIFLDMDNTLICSRKDKPEENYDFVAGMYYIKKRPHVDTFLDLLSHNFEIVVFTAGRESYASPILDELDSKKRISHRLYRDSCKRISSGKYGKDLSETGRDLKNVMLVDDNPYSFSLQPDNGIWIKPFVNNLEDMELQRLIPFLLGFCDEAVMDARDYLRSSTLQIISIKDYRDDAMPCRYFN